MRERVVFFAVGILGADTSADARAAVPLTQNRCSVYVDWRLTVCPGADQGGSAAHAQARQCTHQEAARYLIENVPSPSRKADR